MLDFVGSIFNVPYDNNILLLQLKYHLNGQHVTKIAPVLHSQTTPQATYLPAVLQLCTRIVNAVYVVDKVILRNVSSSSSFCPFEDNSTTAPHPFIHLPITDSMYWQRLTAPLTQIQQTHPIFTTAKPCASAVRSAHGTTINEMSSSSVGITCACQRQSFVGLARRDREKSERFTKTYTMRLRS
jgi:hypothetical protein